MYGNQWSGYNDPSVIEGLKEITEQLPSVTVGTATLKKLLHDLGKLTTPLNEPLVDEPCMMQLQGNSTTVSEY